MSNVSKAEQALCEMHKKFVNVNVRMSKATLSTLLESWSLEKANAWLDNLTDIKAKNDAERDAAKEEKAEKKRKAQEKKARKEEKEREDYLEKINKDLVRCLKRQEKMNAKKTKKTKSARQERKERQLDRQIAGLKEEQALGRESPKVMGGGGGEKMLRRSKRN